MSKVNRCWRCRAVTLSPALAEVALAIRALRGQATTLQITEKMQKAGFDVDSHMIASRLQRLEQKGVVRRAGLVTYMGMGAPYGYKWKLLSGMKR